MKAEYTIFRDSAGIPHIQSDSFPGLYRGLGYAHGKDRGMQALFMRILGQGRVSEVLDSSEASLGIDLFFRRMNWSSVDAQKEMSGIDPEMSAAIEAYCAGMNEAFEQKKPWELSLLGYSPEPWKFEDSLLLARMTGYLTLAQTQGEMERLFVEMVQGGVPDDLLEELFPGVLDGFERELVEKVELGERIVKPADLWGRGVPRISASNNWLVSGLMTKSGKSMLSNDIHLETNRMPNVWYEIALLLGDRYGIGLSMPGMPALVTGRTNDVAWGVTYTFMDSEDSWIERCKDGAFYREEDGWVPFIKRREIIRRKKKEPVEAVFYENLHGVLDVDPLEKELFSIGQERYLRSISWAGDRTGAATMNGVIGMWNAKTTREAMDLLGQLEISFNWVITDTAGDIGYQMSGAMPDRRDGVSGFVPLPGWKPENDWRGIVSATDLPRCYNPDSGYIVTSNQDLNHLGIKKPINVVMGPYRAERIEGLIKGRKDLTADEMRAIQTDVFSVEAEQFMEIIRPLLPDSENGQILADWDCRYNAESFGATLFEKCYRALYVEVFGKGGLGVEVVEQLFDDTGIFIDFFLNFNRVLLSPASAWFLDRSREEIYTAALQSGLSSAPAHQWSEGREVTLSHIIFGGTFPRFLGFDRGPIVLEGGRATVRQGQIYRSAGRATTFAPSTRFIADMAEDHIETNLSGGPSDRRFSKWYLVGLKDWLRNVMKRIEPFYNGKRHTF